LLSAEHLTAEQSLTVAGLFNNVGFDAKMQGKYAEAEPLYERALAIREQHLGQNHPSTQTVRANYVSLLQAMEHDEEARL
jgi:Tetratricopeptide repeat